MRNIDAGAKFKIGNTPTIWLVIVRRGNQPG